MARKSLRPQLNQIRAWVRQGRTDAWIAHQLEVSTSQLREFRRQHDLDADSDAAAAADEEMDLRDEIEAEIEAAQDEEEPEPDEPEPEDEDEEEEAEAPDRGEAKGDGRGGDRQGGQRRRRRRGRRGRGRGRRSASVEATFDHGDEGIGLWLDPAVQDESIYSEHWAGHRAMRVSIEADRIVITRDDKK